MITAEDRAIVVIVVSSAIAVALIGAMSASIQMFLAGRRCSPAMSLGRCVLRSWLAVIGGFGIGLIPMAGVFALALANAFMSGGTVVMALLVSLVLEVVVGCVFAVRWVQKAIGDMSTSEKWRIRVAVVVGVIGLSGLPWGYTIYGMIGIGRGNRVAELDHVSNVICLYVNEVGRYPISVKELKEKYQYGYWSSAVCSDSEEKGGVSTKERIVFWPEVAGQPERLVMVWYDSGPGARDGGAVVFNDDCMQGKRPYPVWLGQSELDREVSRTRKWVREHNTTTATSRNRAIP